MGPIDLRWLRAARLAGATLLAVGAFDVVLRGHSLSRVEEGAILLVAGAALLALHIVFVRRDDPPAPDALVAAALAVPLLPIGIAILAYSPSAATDFSADIFGGYRDAASVGMIVAAAAYAAAYLVTATHGGRSSSRSLSGSARSSEAPPHRSRSSDSPPRRGRRVSSPRPRPSPRSWPSRGGRPRAVSG